MHEEVTGAVRRGSLAVPRIVVAEHVVGADVLPRGPKAVAKTVDHQAWDAVWWGSEAELLTEPKRGGVAYGLKFTATQGNRRGWAVWIDGSFGGAFLFCGGGIVPTRMAAKELKALLAR